MYIESNPISGMIEFRDTRGRLYLLTSPATAQHWSRKDKRRVRIAARRERGK